MRTSQVNVSSPSNEIIFTDTSMGWSVDAINSTSTIVYSVSVDNSLNPGAASYVKLFNLDSDLVSVGSTAPDEVIYAPPGTITVQIFATGAAPGKTFDSAVSACCVNVGGTEGFNSPANPVAVIVSYSSAGGGSGPGPVG